MKTIIEQLFTKKEKKVEMIFENSNTILAGGLDKEDDKLNIEIFLDKEKDKEKIERFLFPKNLVNQYKFVDGKKIDVETYNGENLLIKGNNLQALYTLKERYTNKIDVIYIDPPYYFNKNKSADSFAYNSNFELSTWLVFMKNRLEIAKELLSDTGVIFISMNEDGISHLKLLCNDIFDKTNFIENFHWRNTGQQQNNGKNTVNVMEYILTYSKNKNDNNIKKVSIENRKGKESYRYIEKEGQHKGKLFRVNPIQDHSLGNYNFEITHKITKEKINLVSRIKEKDLWELDNQNMIYWGNGKQSTLPQKKKYLDSNEGVLVSNLIENIYNENSSNDLFSLFNIKNIFDYSKPKELIKYLLEISSEKNSIVLDFFGGSGTTGHAVMDLNKEDGGDRKFIMIEQMDYIETISAERLKRSINKFNYKENFVYCEMEESVIKELKRKLKSIQTKEILYDFVEKHFESKKDEIFSYFNVIEEIAPKKANKLLEMIRILFLYYIPSEYDYTVFDNTNDFSKSLIKK